MPTTTDKRPTLTEADRSALSRMPDGWFGPFELPPVVRCPRFRCDRLHKLGALDWKVIGEFPHLESRYKKIVDEYRQASND